MNIFQRRLFQTAEETISILYLDGRFVCWILEDQYRAVKVLGDTRIPAGEYKFELRKESGQHRRNKKNNQQGIQVPLDHQIQKKSNDFFWL